MTNASPKVLKQIGAWTVASAPELRFPLAKQTFPALDPDPVSGTVNGIPEPPGGQLAEE